MSTAPRRHRNFDVDELQDTVDIRCRVECKRMLDCHSSSTDVAS